MRNSSFEHGMPSKKESVPVEQLTRKDRDGPLGTLRQVGRVANFWARGGAVYLGYKGAQVRAAFLKKHRGWDAERLRSDFWAAHHTWAGDQFYSMAVDLRGFYLKIGQFFAARAEWVPEPICKRLSRLHDQVPPMPKARTQAVLEEELQGLPLEAVFEWIDLDDVLGSASIAQVHKAKLRGYARKNVRRRLQDYLTNPEPETEHEALRALRSISTGPLHDVRHFWNLSAPTKSAEQILAASPTAEQAPEVARRDPKGPVDGIVAVKVQYPDALPVMMGDLKQIRRFAGIIQKLEINFDLLSAVDELADQVRLEFDFEREAKVMDAVADNLTGLQDQIKIPRSVRGLVTERLLVMNFIPGEQISRLKDKMGGLSKRMQQQARQRILHRIADAYGTMLLDSGLFQADPHAGNILIMKGGEVGLIDYGQSKQLSDAARLGFARLVLEMSKGRQKADLPKVSRRLREMGLEFDNNNNPQIEAMMAFGMFDTELTHRVDPFSPHSPIKKLGIKRFPPEVFFVLRTTQMLRGLAVGLDQPEFSAARRWKKLARKAARQR